MVVHRSVCQYLVLDQLTLLQLNAELAAELAFMADHRPPAAWRPT